MSPQVWKNTLEIYPEKRTIVITPNVLKDLKEFKSELSSDVSRQEELEKLSRGLYDVPFSERIRIEGVRIGGGYQCIWGRDKSYLLQRRDLKAPRSPGALDITAAGIAEDIGNGKNPIIPQINMIRGEIEVVGVLIEDGANGRVVRMYMMLPHDKEMDEGSLLFFRTTAVLTAEMLHRYFWKDRTLVLYLIPGGMRYGFPERHSWNVIETYRDGTPRTTRRCGITAEPREGSLEIIEFGYLLPKEYGDSRKKVGFTDSRWMGLKVRGDRIITYTDAPEDSGIGYTDAEHVTVGNPTLLDLGIVNGDAKPLGREIIKLNKDGTVDVFKNGQVLEYGTDLYSYCEKNFSEMIEKGLEPVTSKVEKIIEMASKGDRVVIPYSGSKEEYISLKPFKELGDALKSLTEKR